MVPIHPSKSPTLPLQLMTPGSRSRLISTTCWKSAAVGKIFSWARRRKASHWALRVVIDIIVLPSLIFPPLSDVNEYVCSNPLYMCIAYKK
jgi:hypothetical protein